MNNSLIARILLTILGLVVLFHVVVLTGLIPEEYVWGGRIENLEQLKVMETISLVVNLIAMLVVGLRAGIIGQQQNSKVVRVVLWIFCAFFVLNTVGNIMAQTMMEKSFALVTLLLAYGFFRLARSKK